MPDTDDDPVSIGEVADAEEVVMAYTSRMGMWGKVTRKFSGEGTYIP